MNPTDLTADFILSEVKKLQYLYGLKREIRYGQTRPANDLSESVAEHLYGMNLLAHYFLPLEDPDQKMNKVSIFEMILLHDIDEIETGDTIGYLKTKDMYDNEELARQAVIKKSPEHLQKSMSEIMKSYNAQETSEAKFVKALDRFEPLIQMYSNFGRQIILKIKTTAADSARIKEPYLKDFPVMFAYFQVIQQAMIDENFFTT